LNKIEQDYLNLINGLSPTERYKLENDYVLSLDRIDTEGQKQKIVIGWSLRRLLKYHFLSVLRCAYYLPLEYLNFGLDIFRSAQLRGARTGVNALIIGNGPSQGLLCTDQLNRFTSSGGETFVLNYWFLNKDLENHIPTWVVFSDPKTFTQSNEIRDDLLENLNRNSVTKILVPVSMKKDLENLNIKNFHQRVFFFVDTELSITKNINPLLPRSYITMTLYKALAWAVFLKYEKIGIIGMDNTYPRNIFNDRNNRLLRLEIHSQVDCKVLDQSNLYGEGVASALDRLTKLFWDLRKFPVNNIFNLDPYSLTDRFVKVDFNDFFNDA